MKKKITIRIAGTDFSLSRGSYEIYIQGCNRNCVGCHNPETHSFDGGKEVDCFEYLKSLYDSLYGYIQDGLITDIYVSGGDLLCQDEEVARDFSRCLKYFFGRLRLWLFTGAEEEEIPDWVFRFYDLVKCGRYREDLRNPEGTFPASSNQKLIFGYRVSYNYFVNSDFKGEKKWR